MMRVQLILVKVISSSQKLVITQFADFTLARKLSSSHVEQFHAAVGTDEYKAPEIVTSQPYDGFMADVWSM